MGDRLMRELFFDKVVQDQRLQSELVAVFGHKDTGGKIVGIDTGPVVKCTVRVTDATTEGDETTISNIVTAHDATPPETTNQDYVDAFQENKKLIADIYRTFHDGFRLSNGSIGAFRDVIADTLDLINDLPTSFVTEFQNERTAYYATRFGTPPADDMTGTSLIQCQTYYDFLKPWVVGAMAGLGAALASGLDN
jgi:hypothetical protein